jgi:hypothetical protein
VTMGMGAPCAPWLPAQSASENPAHSTSSKNLFTAAGRQRSREPKTPLDSKSLGRRSRRIQEGVDRGQKKDVRARKRTSVTGDLMFTRKLLCFLGSATIIAVGLSPRSSPADDAVTLVSTGAFTNLIDGSTDASGTACTFSKTAQAFIARCDIRQRSAQTQSGHDPASLQKGDYVALALTISMDPVRQYVFFLNPAGVQSTIGTAHGASAARWAGSVVKRASSWSASFSVPFTSIDLPARGERDVRLGVIRADAEAGTAWGWPHIGDKSPINPAGEERIADPFPR